MATIASSLELPCRPEQVFDFLSDLHNHWQLEDAFIAVNGVRDGRSEERRVGKECRL